MLWKSYFDCLVSYSYVGSCLNIKCKTLSWSHVLNYIYQWQKRKWGGSWLKTIFASILAWSEWVLLESSVWLGLTRLSQLVALSGIRYSRLSNIPGLFYSCRFQPASTCYLYPWLLILYPTLPWTLIFFTIDHIFVDRVKVGSSMKSKDDALFLPGKCYWKVTLKYFHSNSPFSTFCQLSLWTSFLKLIL